MRFELKIRGISWFGQETAWHDVRSYKTFRAAEQAMLDMKPQYGAHRKWKIRDRADNSESLFA
jgi:hypothetical protein